MAPQTRAKRLRKSPKKCICCYWDEKQYFHTHRLDKDNEMVGGQPARRRVKFQTDRPDLSTGVEGHLTQADPRATTIGRSFGPYVTVTTEENDQSQDNGQSGDQPPLLVAQDIQEVNQPLENVTSQPDPDDSLPHEEDAGNTSADHGTLVKCDYCPDVFELRTKAGKQKLRQHLRIHYGELPFLCEVCERGFISSIALMTHSSKHTGIANYECGTPNCSEVFLTLTALQQHERTCQRIDEN